MIGIGNLLDPLIAEDIITCEERDRIILRIAKDNEIDEYRLSVLAGYKRSKAEVLARMEQRKQSKPQHKKQDDSYISLTELARNHSKNTPGYVIQSWLRSENTLAFLNLWEQPAMDLSRDKNAEEMKWSPLEMGAAMQAHGA